MKIALLQCDVFTGDIEHNCKKLLSAVQETRKWDTQLCIAPFEAFFGPNPADFLKQPDLAELCLKNLKALNAALPPACALLCGIPLYPEQALLLDGQCVTVLPQNYYWQKLRICIAADNSAKNKDQWENADLLIRLHAFPYSPTSQKEEEELSKKLALLTHALVLQANLSGAYGSVIYPGASFAINPIGQVCGRAAAFQEDILIIDNENFSSSKIAPYPNLNAAQWQALKLGIRDYVHKAGAQKVIVGLSGGMDSALVCTLAAEALGAEHVIAIMLPSPFSSQGSIDDSLKLCANLSVQVYELPISEIMSACNQALTPLFKQLEPQTGDLTQENLQPRIRALLLMALANRTGALVLNTGNRSEALMGYSTIYGDTVGSISVLGDLYKSRIYELARWHNQHLGWDQIPIAILEKAPSAELRPNQKDTDSLPPYEELDPILEKISHHLMPLDAEKKEYLKIRKTMFRNQFKRAQSPQALQVGSSPLPLFPISGNYNSD